MVLYHSHFALNSCCKCQQQSFTEHTKISKINTVTKEQLIKTLFPGASEIMINLLNIQSNICESSRNARGSVRPKIKILFRWPYDFGIGAHRRMHL